MSLPSLTLVGVGPGDPSLVTLAAVEAIQKATWIAYPVSSRGGEGIAEKIVASWIEEGKKRLPLFFPMVSESEPRQHAWKEASERLVSLVQEGEEVTFLCQGDVSLFASASYVLLYIKSNHPECPVKLIPGVTAVSAAAAAGAWPLALQNDQLLILPTPNDSESLEVLLDNAAHSQKVLVLMKLGSRWTWVRPLLEKKGLLEKSLFAQRIGFLDEQVMMACHVNQAIKPYFSLLLIRLGWPDVLP